MKAKRARHISRTTDRLVIGERTHGVSEGPRYRTEWHGVYAGTYVDEGELYHLFRDGAIGETSQTSFGFPVAQLVEQPEIGA